MKDVIEIVPIIGMILVGILMLLMIFIITMFEMSELMKEWLLLGLGLNNKNDNTKAELPSNLKIKDCEVIEVARLDNGEVLIRLRSNEVKMLE